MTLKPLFFALLFAAAAFAQPPQPARPKPPLFGPGERMAAQPLFNNNCARCHKNVMSSADQNALRENNAPDTDTLARMTPEVIYAALTTGAMVQQAATLTNDEKRVLAEFFGGRPLGAADVGDAKNMTNHCSSNPRMSDPSAGVSWLGWGNDLANTRFQPAKTARLSADQAAQLKLKWAFGLPNGAETYSQPVIVAGRLFLGGDNSFIYSLDAATGCVYWSFQSEAQVRTSIVINAVNGHGSTRYAAYFGDRKANVYAVDAGNGELLWKRNVEPRVLAHITGSPVVYQGRVYVGGGFRRSGVGRSALPLLHVSREPVGAGCEHRPGHLEKLYHPRGAETHEEECSRHAALGARRRFHLEHADHRYQIAGHLCFHR
jgi:polyvinyl alcohol dehydrogenase (cytochrome)